MRIVTEEQAASAGQCAANIECWSGPKIRTFTFIAHDAALAHNP